MPSQQKTINGLLDQLEQNIDAAALVVEDVVTDLNNPDDRYVVDNEEEIDNPNATLRELRAWVAGFDIGDTAVTIRT